MVADHPKYYAGLHSRISEYSGVVYNELNSFFPVCIGQDVLFRLQERMLFGLHWSKFLR